MEQANDSISIQSAARQQLFGAVSSFVADKTAQRTKTTTKLLFGSRCQVKILNMRARAVHVFKKENKIGMSLDGLFR